MPDIPAPIAAATISISLMPSGQIQVTGHIGNKMNALGMLECAKDAILSMHHRAEAGAPESGVVVGNQRQADAEAEARRRAMKVVDGTRNGAPHA